jgi:lipopolysaccharide transport system ATP-binding protein
MSTLSIRASDLTKVYHLSQGIDKNAVDGVSFTLQEGDRLGLIGSNGAGKTTLLQLLAGISEPTSGTLEVHGKVTAIFTVGLGLREELSGVENIYVEGELQGRSREQTRAVLDEIVDFAELGEFIDRPVRTYSTGMKARLAFSTIVHIEPEILIIDEALSVGDARFAGKASRKMRELTARGRILVVVSHSMGSIVQMCTRCLWLDSGAVRGEGAPLEVTEAYLEQVREANEGQLLERFRREVVQESLAPSWSIEHLSVRTGEGLAASTLVTGQHAHLAIEVRGRPETALQACLRIERLDGLLVLEDRARAASLRTDADGCAAFSVDFGPLRLNHGFYRALLETADERGPTARRSVLFEVVNPRPHRGGRPVLVYPTSVRVTALSK